MTAENVVPLRQLEPPYEIVLRLTISPDSYHMDLTHPKLEGHQAWADMWNRVGWGLRVMNEAKRDGGGPAAGSPRRFRALAEQGRKSRRSAGPADGRLVEPQRSSQSTTRSEVADDRP
jgi:hypothetical protein